MVPFNIVVSREASAKTDPKIGPIHGDQPNPNPIPTKKIKLFFGTRTKADLCYYKEMLELEKKIPNFEYVPCLSQEKWEGHNGYVHTAYLPELATADEKPLVYYCGWTKMIEEGRGYLADLGYKMKEDIRVEIFG